MEFMVTPDYLTAQSLLPSSAMSGTTINLDISALTVLGEHFLVVLSQFEDLATLTSQAISENENVLANLGTRRESLKTAIVNHLESISLVQAVEQIDSAYRSLEGMTSTLKTIADYNPVEFQKKFDVWGTSFFYEWYDGSGASWDYSSTYNDLSDLTLRASVLKTDIEWKTEVTTYGISGTMFSLNLGTDMGKEGENLLNSFEDTIEESTSGTGNRSGYGDGIPQAVQEILSVISQNIDTLGQIVQYFIEAISVIIETMEEQDANLASSIANFDLSQIASPSVTVSADYDTYLQESGIFDDMTVIAAFDDQVDAKSDQLADEMSSAFESNLSSVDGKITETNSLLNMTIDDCQSVENYYGTQIYYKKRLSIHDDAEKKFYGSTKDQISIASTITSARSSLTDIDIELTTAATTINTVYTELGNFREPFRSAMEDAFYGVEGLEGIVQAQKSIVQVIAAIKGRFSEFEGQLSKNSGAAIDAFSEKINQSITLMGDVSQLIDDCFGDS